MLWATGWMSLPRAQGCRTRPHIRIAWRSYGVVILSGGTDGTDGPTPAAGALADGSTVARARALGLVPETYLRRNDSYHFFYALDDLLVTGPTGTNVMDMHILLVG